ncbi:MAG: hypothetical protein AAFV43_14280 [Planctomycetota bacterium]
MSRSACSVRWCFLAAGLIVGATAEAWQEALPRGWLAFVVVDKPLDLPDRAAPRIGGLADRLPDPDAVRAKLAAYHLENRPLVVGVAAGQPRYDPFLILPTSDFTGLCETLDADATDREAFATVAGNELRLRALGEWTWIAFSRSPLRPGAAEPRTLATDGDVSLHLSRGGLNELAGLAAGRRARRVATGRPPRYLFETQKQAIASAAELAPIAEMLADFADHVSLGLAFQGDGSLSVRVAANSNADAGESAAGPATATSAASEAVLAVTDLGADEIARLQARGAVPPSLTTMIGPLLACRTDVVAAAEFNQESLDTLADRLGRFSTAVEAIDAVWTVPAADEPLTANRRVAFRSGVDLAALASRAIDAWNSLIAATDCETPLRIQHEPLDQANGLRIKTDVVAALGANLAQPILPMLERVFGDDGVSVERLVKRGDDVWSLTPAGQELDEVGPGSNAGWSLDASIRVDRLVDWQRRIDGAFSGNVIGSQPPGRPAACPPLRCRLEAGTTSSSVQIELPQTVIDLLVDFASRD